jgi:hypothetical protein
MLVTDRDVFLVILIHLGSHHNLGFDLGAVKNTTNHLLQFFQRSRCNFTFILMKNLELNLDFFFNF